MTATTLSATSCRASCCCAVLPCLRGEARELREAERRAKPGAYPRQWHRQHRGRVTIPRVATEACKRRHLGTTTSNTLGDRVVADLRERVTVLPFHERLDQGDVRRRHRDISCLSCPTRFREKLGGWPARSSMRLRPRARRCSRKGIEPVGRLRQPGTKSRIMLSGSSARRLTISKTDEYRWLDSSSAT